MLHNPISLEESNMPYKIAFILKKNLIYLYSSLDDNYLIQTHSITI